MTIKTTQKIIKIGTSAGVTIPARDFKHLGATYGDDVEVTIRPIQTPEQHTQEVVTLTQSLIKRHQKALKNLSQR